MLNFLKNSNQFDPELAWKVEQEIQETEQQMKEDKLSSRFDARFNDKKSWVGKHAELRSYVGKLSYLPQIISALVAFKGGRVLMEWIPIPYLDWIMAALMLLALEMVKRNFSDRFWDQFFATKRINWGAALVNFTALAISVFLSVFGYWFLHTDNSKEANLMGLSGNPEAVALQDQERQIEAKIEKHQANVNEDGVIYWPSQKAIQKLEEQKAEISAILKEEHGIITLKNESVLKNWNIRMNYQKYTGVGITLILELIFEVMMAFCSFYDYKLWLIREYMKKRGKSGHGPTSAPGNWQSPAFALNHSPTPFPTGEKQLQFADDVDLSHAPAIPEAAPRGQQSVNPDRKEIAGFKSKKKEVTTSSYSVATPENEEVSEPRLEMYKQALRSANSNISAWEKKKDSAAKKRNLKKYHDLYDEAAAALADAGVHPDEVIRKRT